MKSLPDAPVYIYTLSDPETDTIRYVGKTNNVKMRARGHYSDTKSNHQKTEWFQSLRSKGLRPVMNVVEETTEQEAANRETFWIERLRQVTTDLLNIADSGKGGRPVKERANIVTTFLVDPARMDALNELAESTQRSRNSLLREAIDDLVVKHGKQGAAA